MGSIMVAGGAGYIGSHCLWLLRQKGHQAFAYDNLSEGHRPAVLDAELVEGELGDARHVERVLREHHVETVFHFAANCYVGVSVSDPARYYENNVVTTKVLLDAMRRAGVKRFIFSSSCATYGEPCQELMDETHPQWPINPYGWTKFVVERMLSDYAHAYGLGYCNLRYFNAAGAHPEGLIGEQHQPETHLLPLVLQVALGQRREIKVFGDDYPTPDGTCIRDYIHVLDLSKAHLLALEYLQEGGENTAFNLGNGAGYSVMEVIEEARRVTGREIPHVMAPRRPGDPARLVGNAARARELLGWRQTYGDLKTILDTAWTWHKAHPHGFEQT